MPPLPQDRNLSYPFARMQWVENTFDDHAQSRPDRAHRGRALWSECQCWPRRGRHPGLRLRPQLRAGRSPTSPTAGAMDTGSSCFSAAAWAGALRGQAQLHDGSSPASPVITSPPATTPACCCASLATLGHDLDGDHYLDLGGDTGLRGYPLRYQNGNERALFTVEERLYTDWYLFRLVNIGAAAFYDMGRTWGTTLVPTPQLGLLKDAGVGLRLGNARSSFGSVVHIDLAVPLDRPPSNLRRHQFAAVPGEHAAELLMRGRQSGRPGSGGGFALDALEHARGVDLARARHPAAATR